MYPAPLLVIGHVCHLDSLPDEENKDLDGETMSRRASVQNSPVGAIRPIGEELRFFFLFPPVMKEA